MARTDPRSNRRGYRTSPLYHDPAALRFALAASGLTHTAFAEAIGRSDTSVTDYLTGDRSAGPQILPTIAAVLKCPVVMLRAQNDDRDDRAARTGT